jgi:hypothetical protein
MLDCAETLLRTSNTHLPTDAATGRVSIAGSRASENWQMRVEEPNGALMWVGVTFAYLIPAVAITVQMLSPSN